MGYALLLFGDAASARRFCLYNRNTVISGSQIEIHYLPGLIQTLQVAEEEVIPERVEVPQLPMLYEWIGDSHGRAQLFVQFCADARPEPIALAASFWVDSIQPFDLKSRDNCAFYRDESQTRDRFWQWSPHGEYLIEIMPNQLVFHYGQMTDGEFLTLDVPGLVTPDRAGNHYTFSSDGQYAIVPHVVEGRNMYSLYHIPSQTHIEDFVASKMLARPRISSSGRYLVRGDREKNLIDVWSLSFDGTGGHLKSLPRISSQVVSIEPAPTGDIFFLVSTTSWQLVRFEGSEVKELYKRTLAPTARCVVRWHPHGRYVGVLVSASHSNASNDVREQDLFVVKLGASATKVPVENLVFSLGGGAESRQPTRPGIVSDFDFEPTPESDLLAITLAEEKHGVPPQVDKERPQEAQVSTAVIYKLSLTTAPQEVHVLDCTAPRVLWAPTGRFLALARPQNRVYFYDAQKHEVMNMAGNSLLHEREINFATDFSWEPSGRYFAAYSSVSARGEGGSGSFGMVLLDHSGRLLYRVFPLQRLSQIQWRPLPASLLSTKKVQEIRSNFKAYAQPYQDQDAKLREQSDSDRHQRYTKGIEYYNSRVEGAQKEQDEEMARERIDAVRLRHGGEMVALTQHEVFRLFGVYSSDKMVELVAK